MKPLSRPLSPRFVIAWVVLVAATFVLGVVGFLCQKFPPGQEITWSDAAYRAFQLFLAIGGEVREPVWQIQVARWIAPLLSAVGLLQWILSWVPAQPSPLPVNHVVICGLGVMGRRFAAQFRKQGVTVVVLERDHTNYHINRCHDDGIQVLIGDAANMDLLQKANIKAASLILCLADDAVNQRIRDSVAVLVTQRTRDPLAGPLRCFLHLNDANELDRLRLEVLRASGLRYDLRSFSPAFVPLEVDAFNIHELSARLLLNVKEHSFYSPGHTASKIQQMVFIGWDQWNQAILIEAVRRWRRGDAWGLRKAKLAILIAHDDPEKLKAQWKPFIDSHKALRETCDFTGIKRDHLSARLNEQTLTFVSLARDAETLLAAQLLCQEFASGLPGPVVVAIKESWHLDPAVLPTHPNLHLYQVQDQACVPARLLGTCESLGRAIHEQYLRDQVRKGVKMGSKPAMTGWRGLDPVYQSSSVRQAASIESNVGQSDYDVRTAEDVDLAIFAFAPKEVEDIARREHERYCQERLVRDPKAASVQPWNELDATTKEIARDQVRAWPWILALLGFAHRKRAPRSVAATK